MKNNYQPVIVVVAFNRLKSLNRILYSLNRSFTPNGTKLIISIDNNGKNKDVAELASEYIWKFGEKEVIYHKERLGLRNHIIKCGDLSFDYGSVIILEDDLFVSPYFYKYAQEALTYYSNCDNIAGISLYNQPYTESNKLPFIPIKDNSDVYFKQIPSSLGQAWSKEHWDSFKKWYDTNPDVHNCKGLPVKVRNWTESSWKKYYYAYLVNFNKYFVFPQISFTTNFNDPGENMIMRTFFGQIPIKIIESPFNFKALKDAINVYDAYSEILPDKINKLCNTLNDYDLEVDLYGKKDSFTKDYVITSKTCKNYIAGFERSMKPHEMNIIMDIRGEELVLAKRDDIIIQQQTMEEFINEYTYFYKNIFDTNVLINLIKSRFKKKIKSYFIKKR
ncbi:MAG: glycosyltransferase family 2 protein [Actinobacteria bacterium]|nr:glycosyltransferase family 2 protein [Actinomycetota bacterium]